MILANYSQNNRNIARDWGAAFTNPLGTLRPWQYLNWNTPDLSPTLSRKYSGFPNGYGGTGYVYPLVAGGLAAVNGANGTGTLSSSIAGGVNGTGPLTGTGTVTATGQLVVSGAADITGTGTLAGNAYAALNGAADLTGAGTLSGTVLADGYMIGPVTGTGTLACTTYATGTLEAAIVPPVTLDAATFSQYLLDQEDVEAGYTLREAMRIVTAALAGKASGAGTSTITFRNITDTANRITATVDSNGNRTAVSLNVS